MPAREETKRSSFSSEMEVAKLSAPPNFQVRYVSCNESAIKRWLSSELEETVFSLTHELFMTQHRGVARILLKGVLNLVSLTRPLFLLLVGCIVLTSLATLSAFSLET